MGIWKLHYLDYEYEIYVILEYEIWILDNIYSKIEYLENNWI